MCVKVQMMTPIFMLESAESRFDGRHDEFSEFMRTEYGSHDAAWILADGAKSRARSNGHGFVAGIWRWFSGKPMSASPEGAEV